MLRVRSRVVGGWLLAAGLAGTTVVGACAEKKGALMLAINTDMRAPKDVNAVSVTISTNGAIKHSFIGRVTPQGEVLLPATLAIVEPDDTSASIRIRVMAFQDRKPRVLRDVRTSVPGGGRTALLRIPLNFVSDKSAMGADLPGNIVPDPFPGSSGGTSGGTSGTSGGTSGASGGTSGASGGTSGGGTSGENGNFSGGAADFDFFGAFQPPCADIENQTIIDGECKDNFVDPETLPDFDSAELGDSTDVGTCFDLARCFSNALGIGENRGDGPSDAGTPVEPPRDAGTGTGGFDASAPPDGGKPFRTKDLRPSAVTLDRSSCTLQLNGANPARLNLAIVTPDTGECVRPGECYVPIDRGGSGWKEENGRVQLPSFVCKLLSGKNLRLATSAETCAAKEEKNPICTPKAGNIDDKPPTNGDGLVVSENFPSTVQAFGGVLFFAGSTAAGFVPAGTAPGSKPTVLKINVPAGALPWRFGNTGAQGLIALTNGTATGYVVQGGDGGGDKAGDPINAVPITVADGTVDVGTATGSGSLVWAVDQIAQSTGGLFTSGVNGNATKKNFPGVQNATAVLGNGTGTVVFGDRNGNVRACFVEVSACGVANSLGSRVDAIVANPGANLAGYALLQDGVYTSTVVDQQTGRIDAAPIAKSNTSAFVGTDGKRYPRGLAATNACVFFSSQQGLEYVVNVGGKAGGGGVLVPASGRTILGVSVDQVAGGGPGPQNAVYYSVFASADKGGGVYRITMPAQCSGGTTAVDAGSDSGNEGGAGQDCGPANCPNGCCFNRFQCVPFPQQNDARCGNSGNACTDCATQMCVPIGPQGGACNPG